MTALITSLKPLKVDMTDSLVLQVDGHLNLKTFGVHGEFHLVRFENEHSDFFSSLGYEPTIVFYKVSSIIEMDFHALLHDLVD